MFPTWNRGKTGKIEGSGRYNLCAKAKHSSIKNYKIQVWNKNYDQVTIFMGYQFLG